MRQASPQPLLDSICVTCWKMLPPTRYSCGPIVCSCSVGSGLDSGLCLSPHLGSCVQNTHCAGVCCVRGTCHVFPCCHDIKSSSPHQSYEANAVLRDGEWGSELWHFQGDGVSRPSNRSIQIRVLGLQMQRLTKCKAEGSERVTL